MTEAFSYNVKVEGISELLSKLQAATAGKVITRSLEQGGVFLAGWIKDNRLTGPRPRYLGVISGFLRSSISSSKAESVSGGWQVRIGTNKEYAPIHEFGFDGMVSVMSHMRKSSHQYSFKEYFARPGSLVAEQRTRTKKVRGGDGFVIGHTRMMHMPARPFLRPALQEPDNQTHIINILTENINKALESKK